MLPSIQFCQWTSYVNFSVSSFFNFLSSKQTNRIKEIALAIFLRIADFFKSFNNQSKEINIKAIAMIGCLSLIALLVISIFRSDTRLMPPPTTPRN
jgi:hypothetical protein